MPDGGVASTILSIADAATQARASGDVASFHLETFGLSISVTYPECADDFAIPLAGSFLPSPDHRSTAVRVTLIDAVTAGPPPEIPWPKDWIGPFGTLRDAHRGPCSFAVDNETQCLNTFLPSSGEAVVWCRDVSRLPYWARATPFRIPLSWIAHTFGGEMIHGAGVVFGDQAVLLLGPGGAGKSTLALAAAQSGLPLLGDDFLMVSGLEAQAIYRRVKAHDETLERLAGGPSIGAILNADAPGEKRILDLDPGLLHADPISIGALVVPRIGVRATSTRMAAPELLRRVLYPSMQGLLGGSGMTLKVLAQLARHLPAYELEVGPDVQDNVAALTAIAEEARETRSSTWAQQDSA